MYHSEKWGSKIIRGPLVQTQESLRSLSCAALMFLTMTISHSRCLLSLSCWMLQENPDHSSKFVLHFTSNVDDQTRSIKAASHAVLILMQLVSLLAMP